MRPSLPSKSVRGGESGSSKQLAFHFVAPIELVHDECPLCAQPGSKPEAVLLERHVRSALKSRHRQTTLACPVRATNGLMHCNIQDRYSITSSAVASSEGGIVRPSAFALLRLTISSNLVGCSTGRSPGFAPFLLGRGPLRVNRVGLSMDQRRPVHPGKQTVPESVRTSR